MTEKVWQQTVVELAQLNGWLVFHPFDSRRSTPGYPDLTLVRDRVVFAELKTEKGRLTPDQELWLERLEGAGAETHVWRPSQFDEVAAILAR